MCSLHIGVGPQPLLQKELARCTRTHHRSPGAHFSHFSLFGSLLTPPLLLSAHHLSREAASVYPMQSRDPMQAEATDATLRAHRAAARQEREQAPIPAPV